MEYVVKKLTDTLTVTGIVNLHFFEFDNDFTTEGERHPFYELVYVNSGTLFIRSEDYTGSLEKNQMIIHRANEEHALRCHAGSEPAVIIIGFECASREIDRFSRAPVCLGDSAIKKLAEIVKEGRNVFKPPYNVPVYDMKKKKNQLTGSEQMLRILLEYFLIRLLREHRHGARAEEGTDAASAIGEVIKYVDENYLEKMTIDELAFLFKTNRATLCKEFKRATGKTLVGYVNDKRYAAARQRIAETGDTFTRIASDLGFESIHYFTRFFKKMSGMTPKEFRLLHADKKA